MILECPQRPQSVMEFVQIVKKCQYSVSMEITEISTRSDSSVLELEKEKKDCRYCLPLHSFLP